jgi:Heavy-metal resistance
MSIIDSLSRPRTLGVLLAIAVAINLLLIGLVAGRISAGWMHPRPAVFNLERAVPFTVGQPHHGGMFFEMRKAMPEVREQHRTMRRLHRQIAQELAKPQPDRTLLDKHFAELRAQSQTIQQAFHASYLDALLKLPPDERRAMVEQMQQHRRWRHGHGRHGGHYAPPFEATTLPLPPTPGVPAENP